VQQRVFNVLIVDDHELVRAGLRRILEDVPTFKVVAEAGSGEEALRVAREHRPDLVIMDIKMPGIGGLAATQKMLRIDPDIKVLIISVWDDDLFPARMLHAGAAGYITKSSTQNEMILALKSICAGQRYISPKIASLLALRNVDDVNKSPFDSLSERELQVMLMVISGAAVQEISEKLSLSPKTINSYRYRIFEKLNVKNDVELTLLAIKYGLLEE
jgi:two-component system invasion response regulator UvrY